MLPCEIREDIPNKSVSCILYSKHLSNDFKFDEASLCIME